MVEFIHLTSPSDSGKADFNPPALSQFSFIRGPMVDTSSLRHLRVEIAVWSGTDHAHTYSENLSIITRRYHFPDFDSGNGPKWSICNESNIPKILARPSEE
ncbi:hypothetical protein AYI69_g730 [Smittium culicis]|uniref:Uncharacterized protein n=1 Tax=Smittium culicis TaxID=133412 RepID=A0A1R1YS73_9FUNG|nr:hypothetical protein AYI69_g730 [Smittium culicis]